MLPSRLVVEIDTREQHPLLFPQTIRVRVSPRRYRTFSLHTVRRTLDAGDYRLSSHPAAGCVERKSGLSELSKNFLTRDRHRFTAAFSRLVSANAYPLLLVEGTPASLLKADPHIRKAVPGEVADYISALSCRTGVPIICMPANTPAGKRRAGEFVARWLVQAAIISDEQH